MDKRLLKLQEILWLLKHKQGFRAPQDYNLISDSWVWDCAITSRYSCPWLNPHLPKAEPWKSLLSCGHSNKRISKTMGGLFAWNLGIAPAHCSTINATVHPGWWSAREVNSHMGMYSWAHKAGQPGTKIPKINAPGLVLLCWGKAELGTRPK